VSLFGQYSIVVLIAVAVCAGVLVPNGGPYIQPFVPVLVMFLVYNFLRGFRLQEIDVASEVRILILSLGISYVLVPLFGRYVARAVLPETAVRGFVFLFAAPTTAVSAVWTRFSNGDVQLATLLLTWLVGSQARVPVARVFTELLVVIGGGILLTILVPRSLLSERTVNTGAMGALVIILYASTAIVDIGSVDVTNLVAVGGVSTVLLGVGVAVSLLSERTLRFDRTQTLPI
jgi:BASS family bile acid:Na+ symporter/sodium/bile acid cotransporter 7